MLGIGLGHPRFVHTDLNMLTQILTLIIIFVSLYYKKKGKLKHHGATMGIAVIVHILTFVLVMGPIFSESFAFFSSEIDLALVQTTWLHVVPGTIAIILAIFLVVKWAINASNTAGCYKLKRIMDITLLLWLFSLAFGIATYILIYF
ncbi:MAG: hypothetical protein CW691_08040 [Candidatus Bathyarchaeum sp.]|nr:MAG: hypothetical protein CW691_08040 [Candidatus Bathyarchaeum sp.]